MRSALFGRKRRRDTRLQNAVALDHSAGRCIERRPVQRMRDRSDQLADCATRQSRIGVEGHDVTNTGRWSRCRSFCRQDAGRRAAEHRVELLQLAAFALPPHPASLGLVPRSLSVEEQEPRAAARSVAVSLVEQVDAGGRGREEFLVAGDMLGVCVEPIRQQRESEITLSVRQVVHLQATDERLDVVGVRQQHRNDDQRA